MRSLRLLILFVAAAVLIMPAVFLRSVRADIGPYSQEACWSQALMVTWVDGHRIDGKSQYVLLGEIKLELSEPVSAAVWTWIKNFVAWTYTHGTTLGEASDLWYEECLAGQTQAHPALLPKA